ncbi:MAG: hypothetical protein ABSC22_09610 [Roseiarcus sp.]
MNETSRIAPSLASTAASVVSIGRFEDFNGEMRANPVRKISASFERPRKRRQPIEAGAENYTVTRIAIVTLLLLGGVANVQADGYPYLNVRKGDDGFASDAASFNAATAFCDKTYGRDNDTSAAHRKCMLSRGWELGKKGIDDKYEDDINN